MDLLKKNEHMKTIILQGDLRTEKSPKELRREGLIPAVVYGKKEQSTSVCVDAKEFKKLLRSIGETTVFDLQITGGKTYHVLVRDRMFDSLSGDILHVDFYAVSLDEAIETAIELEYTGEAPAVKELGATLVKNLDEIDVKALPNDLPSSLVVEVSSLKTFEDVIHIKDLAISDKVTILSDPETIIASVSRPRTEEELESDATQPDVSQIEVEEKGKKEVVEEEEK